MRLILFIPMFCVSVVSTYGQGGRSKPYLPSNKEQRLVVKAAHDASEAGDLSTSMILLDSALSIGYDHMIAQQRGFVKLTMGDSAGYCEDIRTSARFTQGALHDQFLKDCFEKDTVSFENSGLDADRFPRVPNVIKTWSRADGRTEYRLIGHDGLMPVAISTLPGDTTFIYTDKMPQFSGGESKLFEYLGKEMRVPSGGKPGSALVHTQFVVDVDGSISNIECISVDHWLYILEAERVISSMPKWEVGTYRGTPVRVIYRLPIRFSVR